MDSDRLLAECGARVQPALDTPPIVALLLCDPDALEGRTLSEALQATVFVCETVGWVAAHLSYEPVSELADVVTEGLLAAGWFAVSLEDDPQPRWFAPETSPHAWLAEAKRTLAERGAGTGG